MLNQQNFCIDWKLILPLYSVNLWTLKLLLKNFADSAKFLFWLKIDPSIMSCQFMNFWNFADSAKKMLLSQQHFRLIENWSFHYILSIYELLNFCWLILLTLQKKIFCWVSKFLFWLKIDPSIVFCQFMNFWNFADSAKKQILLSQQNFCFDWKLILPLCLVNLWTVEILLSQFCWVSKIFVLSENWSFHYVLSIYELSVSPL